MNRRSERAFALACGLLLAAIATAGEDGSNPEIQYLLDYVAGSGCVFLRNGDAHEAADQDDAVPAKTDGATDASAPVIVEWLCFPA